VEGNRCHKPVAVKTVVAVVVVVAALDLQFSQLLSHESALPPQVQPD